MSSLMKCVKMHISAYRKRLQ